jgi:type III pantothenate kinase
MKLLLDIGNSRIKWAYDTGDQLQQSGETLHRGRAIDTVLSFVEQLPRTPTDVFAGNVAGAQIGEALSATFERCHRVTVRFATTAIKAGGVVNGYTDVSQLGVDRWAAVVGAYTRYQGAVCVVDAGTAVTIDAVDSGGGHLGGVIAPGLHLMRASLDRNTGDIQRFAQRASSDLAGADFFGHDTASAVWQGTLTAVVTLIDSCLESLQDHSGAVPTLVLTGGDADGLLSALSVTAEHRPLLVLEGLRELSN